MLAIVLSSVGLAAWAQSTDIDKIAADLEKRSESVQKISDRIDTGDVPEATLEDDLQTLLGYRHDIQNDAKAFKSAGVEIPFPQRDLHVRSDDGPVGGSTEQRQGVEAGE